ncbi:MAG TPA: hypothetical protein VK726_15830 [Acetobacteraceae bacterium]|jgi:hypothetical protein|nr:hypothetical protein [Acetobacteraceae bacterium]
MITVDCSVRATICVLVLCLLTGCGQAYHDRMACRQEAGAEPYTGANFFGLIGAIVKVSQPEWQDWNQRVADCVDRKKLEDQPTQAAL